MAWIEQKAALELLKNPRLNLWALTSLKNHPDPVVSEAATKEWERRKATDPPRPRWVPPSG